jgi:hypothetical protein
MVLDARGNAARIKWDEAEEDDLAASATPAK